MTTLSRNAGPAHGRTRIYGGDGSGRLELSLGRGTLFLGHGREALTLAGVLALAGIRCALAGALPFTGVGADAVTFASRVGNRRHGRTGQEQGRRCSRNRGTRFRTNLHAHSSK